ncbi:MAG: hypothetical protein EYC67_04950 [Betaproteobacteria bacterium]|nr:MAG: hypothetical protein EYC67_04950 [Betaproteobacteria bacterium]
MTRPRLRPLHCRLRGQSMVELLVVLVVVIGIFALPHEGHGSLLSVFTDAMGIGFDRFLAALSLPQ